MKIMRLKNTRASIAYLCAIHRAARRIAWAARPALMERWRRDINHKAIMRHYAADGRY